MALYAIGDLHLSLSVNKSMEIFGPAWKNYIPRTADALSVLKAEDTLVLAGDTSWGMTLAEAEADFRFLEQFPCRKLLVKGNHDYWWNTAAKMRRFFAEKNFRTLDIIHNNCVLYGETALCGTRGWFWEEDQKDQDAKVFRRELQRLETSLQAAGKHEIICFLHYPPICQGYRSPQTLELLQKYHVQRCFYGHLHGHAIAGRFEGRLDNTRFSLISADYLGFAPVKLRE